MTQINGAALLGSTMPHNQDKASLVRLCGSTHLAWAVLRPVLFGADKDAHARAFMTPFHPWYTHKDDSDKWLELLMGPQCLTIKIKPLGSGPPGSTHLAWAVLGLVFCLMLTKMPMPELS